MKFSIIVPVYNADKYLQKCIDSLLNQTYGNFEVVFVNDGSKDNSLNILKQAEKNDSRIKVVDQNNTGVFQARLNGISAASNDYFLFVDSDDTIALNMLEIVSEAIQKHDADLVIFNYIRCDDEGNTLLKMPALYEHEKIFDEKNRIELLNKIVTDDVLNSLCFKCMKKEYAYQIHEKNMYHHVKMGEDLLQSLPSLMNFKRAIYLDEALYFYRDNLASATHKTKVSYAYDYQCVRSVIYQDVISVYPELENDFFKFYILNIVLYLLLICKSFDRKTYVSAYRQITTHPLHCKAIQHLECASRNSRYALYLCNPICYLLLKPFAYLYFMLY